MSVSEVAPLFFFFLRTNNFYGFFAVLFCFTEGRVPRKEMCICLSAYSSFKVFDVV